MVTADLEQVREQVSCGQLELAVSGGWFARTLIERRRQFHLSTHYIGNQCSFQSIALQSFFEALRHRKLSK